MNYDYDLAVLGAGPGGYEAAIRAAKRGKKVALIEERELGGTCLNRGCIPTKALLHGAEVYYQAKNAEAFGVSTGAVSVDYGKLVSFKNDAVARLRKGVAYLEKTSGVAVISGRGTISDAHTLTVNGEKVTFENLIVAVGSSPAVPPIPGADGRGVMTSDGVLELESLPKSIVIIGGGVIGVEFATLFGQLGVGVTVVEMLDYVIPGIDDEIRKIAVKSLKKLGVKVVTGAKVTKIESGDAVRVSYDLAGAQNEVEGEICAICVGRRPNTKAIGLEEIGVKMNRGFVEVDDQLRSSVPNIYAIGDATGKIQLAHVATKQGFVAVDAILGMQAKMSYDVIPACVYMSPEIAWVGLSEKAALDAGRKIRVGRANVAASGRCAVMGEREGMVKIVTDDSTGEILGCQIIAPRATDMIAEIAAVMTSEGTVDELADAVHPHPTVSELICEAARAAV